ncbi:MAG: hypothetical protein QGH45_07195 [Myxococcota bacterium]|nr:hypothetical protein [Myxococcota bacterium]
MPPPERRPHRIPILLIALTWLLGCGPAEPPEPLPPTIAELDALRATAPLPQGEPAPRLTLAFTLGERGDLRPCACPDGVTGGFARRASFVDALRSEIGSLVVVAGPESLAPAPGHEGAAGPERTGALLDLHRGGGTDVIALGAPDLAGLDFTDLPELVAASGLPMIATNLDARDGTELPVARVQLLEVGGRRIAVLSVLDPTGGSLSRGGLIVTDPVEGIRAALAGLTEPPDAVVAFSDAAPRRLLTLSQRWTEVDFVIGSAQGSGPGALKVASGGRAVGEDPTGLRVGLLDLVLSGPVGGGFLDDERLRDLADQRLAEQANRARAPWIDGDGEPAPPPEEDDRVAALGRRLPASGLDGHCYGYRSSPLLKIIPEHSAIADQVGDYYADR